MNSSEENKSSPRESALSPEDAEILLPIFREEIRVLKAAEEENQKLKKTGTANLLEVKVDELTVADMEMWEAVKNYSTAKVPQEVFAAYRELARASGNKSRADFPGFLANKLSAAMA